MDLAGKAALVTGASGDIGGAIARALATAGVDIAVGYVGNVEGASACVRDVEAAGRRAFPIQCDQASVEAIDPAVDAVAAHFGRLDILVNNAAWNIGIPFPSLTPSPPTSGTACTTPTCAARSSSPGPLLATCVLWVGAASSTSHRSPG
ncbi:MAG: SDR family NAD(P)-dependent oxidoreductase [Thermoflexaceae bacterium]|nr:SDR family NAD(P)-dependent oxidoreductase [Thermoflexaceae bacterium]